MENRIKEQQLGLFAAAPPRTTGGPTSSGCCSPHWHVLMEGIRRLALKGTKLARAQVTTIRLKAQDRRGDPA